MPHSTSLFAVLILGFANLYEAISSRKDQVFDGDHQFRSKTFSEIEVGDFDPSVYFDGPVVSTLGDDLIFRRRSVNNFCLLLALPEDKAGILVARKIVEEVNVLYTSTRLKNGVKNSQHTVRSFLASSNIDETELKFLFITQFGSKLEILGNVPIWIGHYRDEILINSNVPMLGNGRMAKSNQSFTPPNMNSSNAYVNSKFNYRWTVKVEDIVVVCPTGLSDYFTEIIQSVMRTTRLLEDPISQISDYLMRYFTAWGYASRMVFAVMRVT